MRLYAARPTSAYGTALDSRQLAVLRRRFPTAELADPAKLWTSNEAWLGEWPEVLTQLDLLALWAGEDGQLGAGVLRELADAVAARLPIGPSTPKAGSVTLAASSVAGGCTCPAGASASSFTARGLRGPSWQRSAAPTEHDRDGTLLEVAPGLRSKNLAGAAVLACTAVLELWRWLSRSNTMTWEQLARRLDAAGLPRTVAGVAALRRSSEADALAYLRSLPETAETAEILSDPCTMADLASSDEDERTGRRGIPWEQVKAELARRRG